MPAYLLPYRAPGFLPLSSPLGTVQAKHRLGDKAPWPVWRASTGKPVDFTPMSKRAAVKLWHNARAFERQTRKPGHQDGAIGRNGLAVLHALLFDLLDHATGRLDPTRATIARAACISVRSVDRGLAKLKAAGVLNWARRFAAETMTQIASAYSVLAQAGWRGFWQAPEPPAPYPETWGARPPLPDPMTMAAIVRAKGGSVAAQIAAMTCDPRDGLANSLARCFASLNARKS